MIKFRLGFLFPARYRFATLAEPAAPFVCCYAWSNRAVGSRWEQRDRKEARRIVTVQQSGEYIYTRSCAERQEKKDGEENAAGEEKRGGERGT